MSLFVLDDDDDRRGRCFLTPHINTNRPSLKTSDEPRPHKVPSRDVIDVLPRRSDLRNDQSDVGYLEKKDRTTRSDRSATPIYVNVETTRVTMAQFAFGCLGSHTKPAPK